MPSARLSMAVMARVTMGIQSVCYSQLLHATLGAEVLSNANLLVLLFLYFHTLNWASAGSFYHAGEYPFCHAGGSIMIFKDSYIYKVCPWGSTPSVGITGVSGTYIYW